MDAAAASTTMDPQAYRQLHEDFMKNHNGTNIIGVFATILPSYWTTFCVVSLQAMLAAPLPVPARFLLEYITIVWTVVLNVTVLHSKLYEIVGALLLLCATVVAKQLCNRTHVLRFVTQIPRQRPDFVACLRATTNLITAVCILAVDFRAFPRQLAKTETYGFALMDTGVGLYVFNNALVDAHRNYGELTAPLTAVRLRRLLGSVAPLLVLGAGRFFVTTSIEYQQHVSEYGVHWNFFVTLALTRLLGAVVLSLVGRRRRGVPYAALAVLLAHQAMLLAGVARWVVSTEVRRDGGWLAANREGVASLPGYLGLYLACIVLGQMMQPEQAAATATAELPDNASGQDSASAVCTAYDLLRQVRRIAIGTVCVAKLAWDCERTFGVSRRLADLGYVLWILFIAGAMTSLFMLLEVFYHCLVFWKARGSTTTNGSEAEDRRNAEQISRYTPLILAAINYNGLAFFLVANLLTGAVNMSFQTLLVGSAGCVFIVSVYMFVLCAVVVFLYVNEIRLKY